MRRESRWWWPLAYAGELLGDHPVFLLGLLMVGALIAVCGIAYAIDPCARQVEGDVQVVGPGGAPAVVHESWCVEWKPGRAPEGGAP